LVGGDAKVKSSCQKTAESTERQQSSEPTSADTGSKYYSHACGKGCLQIFLAEEKAFKLLLSGEECLSGVALI